MAMLVVLMQEVAPVVIEAAQNGGTQTVILVLSGANLIALGGHAAIAFRWSGGVDAKLNGLAERLDRIERYNDDHSITIKAEDRRRS